MLHAVLSLLHLQIGFRKRLANGAENIRRKDEEMHSIGEIVG
ncbi:protein of unknown function [Xenorhabdus poinarii G6]|uniref:Uncharacterized protein n=1 Tax=Xenorhabdus poinarii G6 TaxID=1354304 RepID=A0A068R6S0_9GAMM|nr:protein of unknown function [Xenorhabdus poinarii G6]